MYGKMRLTQKLKQNIKEYREVIVNKLQQEECACVRVCVRETERDSVSVCPSAKAETVPREDSL